MKISGAPFPDVVVILKDLSEKDLFLSFAQACNLNHLIYNYVIPDNQIELLSFVKEFNSHYALPPFIVLMYHPSLAKEAFGENVFNFSIPRKYSGNVEFFISRNGISEGAEDQAQTQILSVLAQIIEVSTKVGELFLYKRRDYYYLDKPKEISDFLHWAEQFDFFSHDWETSPNPPYHKDFKLLTTSFSREPGESFCFGLLHREAQMTRTRKWYPVWNQMVEFIRNKKRRWVGHNYPKFDKPATELFFSISLFEDYDDFHSRVDDTMMMKYTLNESAKGRYKLKTCAKEELRWPNWGIDTSNLEDQPLARVLPYNAMDTDATMRLYYTYKWKLHEFSDFYSVDLWDSYRNLHLPNSLNAALLDGAGILCNEKYALEFRDASEFRKEQYTQWLRTQPPIIEYERRQKEEYMRGRKIIPPVGSEKRKKFDERMEKCCAFSPTGDKGMKEVLYEIMALPYPEQFGRTEKTQDVRVTGEVLNYLGEQGHGIPKILAKIASISDDLSDYIYPVLRNRTLTYDGMSHASFMPVGTETGRYSCKNGDENTEKGGVGENLQKISRRPEIKGLYKSRFPD